MATDFQSTVDPGEDELLASNDTAAADATINANSLVDASDPAARSMEPDPSRGEDGNGVELAPQQPEPANDQPVPAMPRYGQDATTPSGTLAMRLFSRMQGDLNALTEGKRAATPGEVRTALLHAVRIEAPERLRQVMATAGDASPRLTSPTGPGSNDPIAATPSLASSDFGSSQRSSQFEPAIFVKNDLQPGESGDIAAVDGAPSGSPEDEAARLMPVSLLDEDKPYQVPGIGEAFFRALAERRERLAEKLDNVSTSAANAYADAMRGPYARDLTPGERQLLTVAFGEKIDLRNVRIVNGAGLNLDARGAFMLGGNPAITEGNTVYINPSAKTRSGAPVYSADLSKSSEGIETLLHEFTHVFQYQNLGFSKFFRTYAENERDYGAHGLSFDRDAVYNYEKRNLTFQDETLEGQSEMVGQYAQMLADKVPANNARRQAVEWRLRGTGIYGF